LPPIAIDAGRWLLKSETPAAATRVRFQYGQFFLECDSPHHLPKVLAALPNFGRNLADIVGALEARELHVIDVGRISRDTAPLLAGFATMDKRLP
jgi:hypothetical protein